MFAITLKSNTFIVFSYEAHSCKHILQKANIEKSNKGFFIYSIVILIIDRDGKDSPFSEHFLLFWGALEDVIAIWLRSINCHH